MINVSADSTAVWWESGLNIDADGSPHAYHPGGGGLDALGNAGHPGNWYGLACDEHGEPFVQGEDDPAPGFYVSTTALVDHSKAAHDPRRYVDSSTVPYISIPPELRQRGVKLGDLCLVSYADKSCAAVVADIGPHGKYGEGSIALAEALGIPSSPRHGGCSTGVTFKVFIGSTKGWPRTLDDINEKLQTIRSTK